MLLPYLTFGAGAQGTPTLRPQFGPNVQPRQTSWSKKSLRGFCKPQENCPVDTVNSVQWERVITEDRSSEQHCGTALSNEMNWSFLLILAEGTYRFVSETHSFEVSIKIGMTGESTVLKAVQILTTDHGCSMLPSPQRVMRHACSHASADGQTHTHSIMPNTTIPSPLAKRRNEQGCSQKFAKGDKRGGLGDRSPPSGSKGRAPVGV